MLEIKNVSKTFAKDTVNEHKALNNINLTLNDGEFEGIFIRKPKNPQELQAVINSFVTLKPNDQIIGVHSDYFRITSDQEVAYTLDGENGGSHKKVEIECCYRPIEYVCG